MLELRTEAGGVRQAPEAKRLRLTESSRTPAESNPASDFSGIRV